MPLNFRDLYDELEEEESVLDSFDQPQQRQNQDASTTGQGNPDQPGADSGGRNAILDILAGAGNGVFNAVDSTVGLTGIDLGIEDIFGETETFAGSAVEGITQFAVGFVPVFGALSKAGKLGAIGRGFAASAAADFAVFDGQEERLSNLIQEVPGLANPVTEYMAYEEGDSQLEGRIKNALEGAALGSLFDGFVFGLRQLKAGRKARAEGLSPEEAAERVREVEAPVAAENLPADPYTRSVAESLNIASREAEALVALQDAMGIERDSVRWVRGGEAADGALEQTAFHGSAYKFDKFSTEHIGKGEGNQAYGWGLYFAEDRQVAEHYKETVARLRSMDRERVKVRWDGIGEVVSDISQGKRSIRSIETAQDLPPLIANNLLEKSVRYQLEPDKAVEAALKDARWYVKDLRKRRDFTGAPWGREGELYDEQVRLLELLQKDPQRVTVEGRTEGKYGYEVELAPKDDELFDLDAIVDEQSPAVMRKLEATDWWDDAVTGVEDRLIASNPTGLDVIRYLEEEMDPEEVSKLLLDAGIKGSKYFDGNSRRTGKGNRNYVIFDGADVEITGLFQGGRRRPKGSVEFTHDADAVIRGFASSDFSTGVHELAHVARRRFINLDVDAKARLGIEDADIKAAEDWAGATDGKWSVEAEEKFAEGFEKYISEGVAPTTALEGLFRAMRDFIADVYARLGGGATGVSISPEMRQVFDKLVSGREVRPQVGADAARIFDSITEDQVRAFIQRGADLQEGAFFQDIDLTTHPRSGDPETREILGLPKDYYSIIEAAGDEGAAAIEFHRRQRLMPIIRQQIEADRLSTSADIDVDQERLEAAVEKYQRASGASSREEALALLQRRLGGIKDLKSRVLAVEVEVETQRMGWATSARDHAQFTRELKEKMDRGIATEAELATWVAMDEVMNELTAEIAGIKSSKGRAFRRLRDTPDYIGGPGGAPVLQAYEGILSGAGGRKNVERRIRALVDKADADGDLIFTHEARKANRNNVLNATLEYWMNSILSGLKTITINGISGAAVTLYRPLEGMVGAAAKRNWDEMRVYAETYMDLLDSTAEAWRYSKEAFGSSLMKEGENRLLPDSRTFKDGEARQAISAAAFGKPDDSPMGKFLNKAGPIVRLPSRTLQATDEFFKQLNARAIVKRGLRREGLEKGLNGDALGQFISDGLDKIITDGQLRTIQALQRRAYDTVKAANPQATEEQLRKLTRKAFNDLWEEEGKFAEPLVQAAKDYAEETTATKALPEGSIGKWLQDVNISHPLFRFVLPFVRTPVNLLGAAYDRSPIAVARHFGEVLRENVVGKDFPRLFESQGKLTRELNSPDPAVATEAYGRAIMATGTFFTLMGVAAQGRLTGRGPTDKELRRQLEATGWQPYSIKIGDTYVSYNRLDPFATVIGVMADFSDYGRWSDVSDQGPLERQMWAVISAMTQNFTNKSYVTGIRSFVELLQNPEANAPEEGARLLSSFIPNIIGQTVGVTDPYARELRSFSDSFTNRVPYLSDNLDPVRNVLGEPVDRVRSLGGEDIPLFNAFLPIAARSTKDKKIHQELADLAWPFSPPPKAKQGQDLTQILLPSGHSAYDRWQELTGQVRIGRSTLKSDLRRLISSSRYQSLPPESEPGYPSPRVEEIRKVLRHYRSRAWSQLLREVPELRQATTTFERERSLRRRGSRQAIGFQ